MDLREQLCDFGLSLYNRGLTHGSTGNLSVRLPDGTLLVTPTGSSLGRLTPEGLSVIKPNGELVSGPKPTKEVPLHQALYSTRGERAGAVVHLHSCYATALSLLPDQNEKDWLPHLTPYGIMQLGQVRLLPYFIPGSPEIGSEDLLANIQPSCSQTMAQLYQQKHSRRPFMHQKNLRQHLSLPI